MSKTNFTTQTKTIEVNVDMLNYFYYTDSFSSDEIKDIILICDKLDSEISTINYNDISVGEKRVSSVGYLPLNEKTEWIYKKVYGLASNANEEMNWNFDVEGIDNPIEYNIYDDNSGEYRWYSDINNSNKNKLSVTIHLSTKDEYTGGKTEFNNGDEIIKPSFNVGDVVISPSYLLQRITPILTGVKRTLSLNITGNPFK